MDYGARAPAEATLVIPAHATLVIPAHAGISQPDP